ncbi:hydrogenase 4 subunit F [Ferrimonas balearica]|uniref:hydrogenase 4 subunit F n=1 Tax=Ferrimonas balearica TaxID=44012 RepID=UPI001C9549B9|nr:hydrogenase 4 subunit F [Ferrimonas balearica]MBY5979433.1 hydrogenase 4 subunit F [Ferrimonas balearica]
MLSTELLPLILIVPVCAALIAFITLLWGPHSRRVSVAIHLLSMGAILLMSLAIAVQVYSIGPLTALGGWLYVDALSALFLAVLGLVALITGIYSIGYIGFEYRHGELDDRQVKLYYGLFNIFVASMLLAVLSNNVIMMWVAIEATTICSVFLVGLYGQRSSLEAAWKYIVVCNVGLAFGLFGSVLTYSNAAAVLAEPGSAIFWTAIKDNAALLDPTLVHLGFIFALIGFGTKTGLFPMHAWLPDAHSEAPSPVSALLSAGLLNCALLVLLRYYMITVDAIGASYPNALLMIFGFLSVAVSAFFIVTQRDIKRKLAYSSVENMGLITLAVTLGPIGVVAALMHVINHSLAKALMFCGAGNILLKYGSRDMDVVKGVLKAAPLTGVMVALGALALGGVPPFSLFVSEFTLITAGLSERQPGLMLALLLLLTLVLGAMAHLVSSCVMGEKPEQVSRGELGWLNVAPMLALLAMLVVMGTQIPASVLKGIDQAAVVLLNSEHPTVVDSLDLPWQHQPVNVASAEHGLAAEKQ